MKQIYFLLLNVLILSSCNSLGTKTLYKKDVEQKYNRIGFTMLDCDTSLLKTLPKTDSIFNHTFKEEFKNSSVKGVYEFKNRKSYLNSDYQEIKKICNENNLDGIIVSKITFVRVTYTLYGIPVAKNWDAIVEMKLIDKIGRVILIVSYNNSKGNSYLVPPSSDVSTRDCTKGAIKRIKKELKLNT